MIVGKNIMKEENYNKIFTFTKYLTPQYNFRKKLSWKGKLIDQDVINEIFVNYTLIPNELYNQSHFLINNLNYKDTKIIHYCGAPKPWKELNFRFEMAAMIFYKYYFMRTNNFILLKDDKENN
jgi:lipopolysaccharide biosynthesis glycosyltransferase